MKIFDNPVALIVILLVIMMIFGVGKLPQVGSSLGKTIRSFREGAKDENNPDATDAAPKAKTADATAEPLSIAKERYAKGEITKEEYEGLKNDLA